MRIEGRIIPPQGKEKYWAVSIDSMAIFTQGTSEKDAYRMAADAVEMLAEDAGTPFKATIEKGSERHTFTVNGSDPSALLRFAFRRMRAAKNLTLMDVSKRLDSKSPNAYAKFERGTVPRLDTLEELIHAIDPDLQLVLKKRA
jgi:catalase